VSANASVLALGLLVLASTPLTVRWPADLRGAALLVVALGSTLGLQIVVSRRILAPLGALWQHMQSVDPLRPGHRIDVHARSVEVTDLVDAFNGMLDRLEAERRDSARRAQAAQEAERRRLSLELHDEIGQDLTALLLNVGVARTAVGDAQRDAHERAIATVGDCLEHVRAIVQRLRPAGLDELGLVSALVHLCERIGRTADVDIQPQFQPGLPPLSADAQLGVFRVAQESLTIVVRHAAATTATLTLAPRGAGVRLTVADDGVGLPPDRRGGSGIRGMRERALLLGAALDVAPALPRGTVVTLDVPESETEGGS
jgi:two-component system sensor histidine kinase UhpB